MGPVVQEIKRMFENGAVGPRMKAQKVRIQVTGSSELRKWKRPTQIRTRTKTFDLSTEDPLGPGLKLSSK